MARPRRDGLPSSPPNKRKLTDQFIGCISSDARTIVWDTKVGGLALAVYPTGRKVFKCVYPFQGRTRWYTIGRADAVNLKDARKLAGQVLLQVATDVDPQAERRAARSRDTFEELAKQYVEQHAKKKNKSWRQSEALVQKHLLPKWGKLRGSTISRNRREKRDGGNNIPRRGQPDARFGVCDLGHQGGSRRREGEPLPARRPDGDEEPRARAV